MTAPRPTVDPAWIRDTLIEDRLAWLRGTGRDPSSADVETLVTEELRIADAVEREAEHAVVERKPVVAPNPSKRAQRVAEKSGHTVYKSTLVGESAIARPTKRPSKRTAFLSRKPKNEREAKIIARLSRIVGIKSRFRPSLTNDYTIPALADEWATLMVDVITPRGDFVGKSVADSERMFWAKAERICDKSTGKLGPWWVK